MYGDTLIRVIVLLEVDEFTAMLLLRTMVSDQVKPLSIENKR